MIRRLRHHWGLKSNLQVSIVFLVFSLAGMSILPARKWIFHVVGVNESTPMGARVLLWLAIVFPAYQLFLLAYGALFGQFRFFWEKEKRLARWIGARLGLTRRETA